MCGKAEIRKHLGQRCPKKLLGLTRNFILLMTILTISVTMTPWSVIGKVYREVAIKKLRNLVKNPRVIILKTSSSTFSSCSLNKNRPDRGDGSVVVVVVDVIVVL